MEWSWLPLVPSASSLPPRLPPSPFYSTGPPSTSIISCISLHTWDSLNRILFLEARSPISGFQETQLLVRVLFLVCRGLLHYVGFLFWVSWDVEREGEYTLVFLGGGVGVVLRIGPRTYQAWPATCH